MKPYTGKRRYNSNLIFNSRLSTGNIGIYKDIHYGNFRQEDIRLKAYRIPGNPKKVSKTFWNSTGWLVITLFGIAVAIFILGYLTKDLLTEHKFNVAEADIVQGKINQLGQLNKQNTELKTRVAMAEYQNPHATLTESGWNKVVDLVFPKQAGERYKRIVETCENSKRNPLAIHTNNDAHHTQDAGVSQINLYWHEKEIKEIFNEDPMGAMTDSVKNIVYAAMIYKAQGNFTAWSCDAKVGGKA